MTHLRRKIGFLVGAAAVVVFAAAWAQAAGFDRIVVFGGSVSDSGNLFALTGVANRPPYDQLDPFLVPSAPYSIGGDHFSNGATWIEQFARPIGLEESVRPAYANASLAATNYAVGGARAREDGINVNMPDQVSAFLTDFHDAAPSEALYVIDFGGNDIRDVLLTGDPAILGAALQSLSDNMLTLYGSGARKFLVVNVANIGQLPSIRLLDAVFPGAAFAATFLSGEFNGYLDNLGAVFSAVLPGIEITKLDVFATVENIIAHPDSYGLQDVTDACITPHEAPFTCQKPERFLFWDGIHPTKAVHAIFANEAGNVLGN